MKLLINELSKSFDKKEVLKSVDCEFEKGKIYGLLGRNGAGKTTLFNCISEEITYESGEIVVDDGFNKRTLDFSDIGFVYSTPVLPEFMTGYEFVKFYIDINKDKITNPMTIDQYFDIVKIDKEDRYRLIKDYSHGMKNKIQILCVIISRPLVLLLDEPLTSFDVVVAHEIKEILKLIKKDHIIVLSTHIMQIASDVCDEVVILHQGKTSVLDEEQLHSPEFEEKLISILSDEDGESDV